MGSAEYTSLMIDELEIKLAGKQHFSAAVQRFCETGGTYDQRYVARFDLRAAHLPAMLHYGRKHTVDEFHKLSLMDVAQMPEEEILDCIEKVTGSGPRDILDLGLLRVDYAIDVPDIDVRWFRNHSFVARKKYSHEFGKNTAKGRSIQETLAFGYYGDRYTIYDKIAQIENENVQRQKRCQPLLGVPEGVLTRVERQTTPAKWRKGPHTLGELFSTAADLTPFSAIKLPKSYVEQLNIATMKPSLYHKVRAFEADVARDGLARAQSRLAQAEQAFRHNLQSDPGEHQPPVTAPATNSSQSTCDICLIWTPPSRFAIRPRILPDLKPAIRHG